MKEFTGKVIKVGSSLAVTLPAKEAKTQNIAQGNSIKFSYELINNDESLKEINKDFEKFEKIYSAALKNLANR